MSIRSELRSSSQAREIGRECDLDDCTGMLWNTGSHIVCESCFTIVEQQTQHDPSDPWEQFRNNRDEDYNKHSNSDEPRCVGGFPHVYDWVKRSDIDYSIAQVDPTSFYK